MFVLFPMIIPTIFNLRFTRTHKTFSLTRKELILIRINLVRRFSSIHNKWFVNLSSSDIPLEVQYWLQLGEKFGLPINRDNKEKTLIEFINHIENYISGRPKNIINFVRNNSISILNRFNNNFPSLNFTDKRVLKWLYVQIDL